MPKSARFSLIAVFAASALALLLFVAFAPSSGLAMVEPGVPISDLVTHTVGRGDSLGALARRYGVSVEEIVAANTDTGVLPLYRGSRLIVPVLAKSEPVAAPRAAVTIPEGTSGVVYQVRRGDRLTLIAARFGVTAEAIVAANGLSGRQLYFGQPLVIPVGAEKAVEAKSGDAQSASESTRLLVGPEAANEETANEETTNEETTNEETAERAAAAAAAELPAAEVVTTTASTPAASAPQTMSAPITVEVPVTQIVTVIEVVKVTESVPVTVVETVTVTEPAPPVVPVKVVAPETQVVTVTESVPVTVVEKVFVTQSVPITVVETVTVTEPGPPAAPITVSEPVTVEVPVTVEIPVTEIVTEIVTVTESVPITVVETVTVTQEAAPVVSNRRAAETWEAPDERVLLFAPVAGGAYHSPIQVAGLQRPFMGTLQIYLTDPDGRILARRSGSGMSGGDAHDFRFADLRFSVTEATPATATVAAVDAVSGMRMQEEEIPLILLPGQSVSEIYRPTSGAAVCAPLIVAGQASTPAGSLMLELRDADGATLDATRAQTGVGGTYRDFATTFSYAPEVPTPVLLVAYAAHPTDANSSIDYTATPLTLYPADSLFCSQQ